MPPCYKISVLLIDCVPIHWSGWVTITLLIEKVKLIIMSWVPLGLPYFCDHLHISTYITSYTLQHFSSWMFFWSVIFFGKVGRWFGGRLWILCFEVWCNTSILSNLFSSWVHWHFMDCGNWLPNVPVGRWWRCCLTFKLYLGHTGSSLCSWESDLNLKKRRKIGRKVSVRQGRFFLLLWLGFLFSGSLFLCFKKCLVIS